jgi:NAD(P)-dependent dehydrogenase (short-subunit alcohol dehydrogenase family)
MEGSQGKTALITGGSVGTSVAEAFLKSGSNVAFVYRNPQRLSALNGRFAGFEDAFLPVQADLSDFAAAKAAVELVDKKYGGVHFLVNSLGGWIGGKKLHEHSASEFNKMLLMDAVPTFNIMSAVLPVMMKQQFGRIVNFISMQVFASGAGNAVYTASKSAVLAMTEAAAEEYKSFGISTYAIAPSTIDTENNRRAMPKADPDGWVKIEEIVHAVSFLCGGGGSCSTTVIKFITR